MSIASQLLRHGLVFARAKDASGAGNVEAAVAMFDKAFGTQETGLDTARAPLLALLFYAKWCLRLRRPDEALSAIRAALERIEKDKTLGLADRLHVEFYCKWLLGHLAHSGEPSALPLAATIPVTYKHLNATRTNFILRSWFVISRDAGPSVDRWVQESTSPLF